MKRTLDIGTSSSSATHIGNAVAIPWPISIWFTMTVVMPSAPMRSHATGEKSPCRRCGGASGCRREFEAQREAGSAERDDAQKVFAFEGRGHASAAADLIASLMRP